ncbi:MAG: DNA polymerase III subunit gamma/tau [Rhodospirillaceae bacterium]|jgi:DNA polymerase III subunit gamma/tau|nr:DNA polymerase III subunit gamma/tau [Rhodospirillaceae bacterium]MBT4589102.1 DNA polymerase III subunit gamma/tau [Rhodospirillaceae bacterium]MBT4940049.1 DNA polymerase III subunit gamma/tau [Rhodospirillaceae bacterium]MBT5940807.1 DNA polymerase III subunit gamma/tau [Rhodospirillaceae bacterium]MBT7267255.1 DNA polymerase III subunit gamma/tau [Rhodospirillaceae bacterium]
MSDPKDISEEAEYQVLARKYRPTDFTALIGQDAMVRTLKNAFESGRLAHAFILTGVRGVGKTTTARIIARALNCVGPDGKGEATIEPCGVCEFCQAIAEDRLVDVLEMDAASRTGVDDVRELIEGVRYKPVSARYKVYIIDEVHMLSRNAFNALLKTLEEPPAHVKFIFATTEIRKVPVTVLSRCQRFDLRRVDIETLSENFKQIAEKEGVKITDTAISLIARAADGSVRDGQSLLDQVIATGAEESEELSEDIVRDMLGLADRERSFDLFELVMKGDVSGALEMLDGDYANGADPIMVLQDLLEVVHWLSRVKVTPEIVDGPMVPEADCERGKDLTERLSMGALTRSWQMLLKGLREAQTAPSPIQAAEMILIRLAYLADLPTPADAVKAMADGSGESAPAPQAPPPSGGGNGGGQPVNNGGGQAAQAQVVPEAAPQDVPQAYVEPIVEGLASPETFEDVIALADKMNERILRANLVNNVHLVRFEPGTIVFQPGDNTPREFSQELTRFLNGTTDRRWVVSVSMDEKGGDTVQQRQDAIYAERLKEISETPFMQTVLETFPGAEISEVREIGEAPDIDVDMLDAPSDENIGEDDA